MMTWESMVFDRSELRHMEALVHAFGVQTGGDKAVWRETVVPVIYALVGRNLEALAVAVEHLFAIYAAPEEWVRANEHDALLTEKGRIA